MSLADMKNTTAPALTGPQKAAIVVRLLADGAMPLTLQDLPEAMQADLIRTISEMGPIDPGTLDQVTEEFSRLIEGNRGSSGLDIEEALSLLGESISPGVARRLRRDSGTVQGDPWDRIRGATAETLLPMIERESIEVAAVVLSKLNVPVSAALLNQLPGDRARRITLAISQTANVRPDAVRRIGIALVSILDEDGETGAFSDDPSARIGAILNLSRAATREEMLAAIQESDADLAANVKRAIFTFANIPDRLSKSDVPKVTRQVEQTELVRALAMAQRSYPAAFDFILSALPQRMADNLRGDIEDMGPTDADSGEAAMTAVIAAIREMETAGEIYLIYEAD